MVRKTLRFSLVLFILCQVGYAQVEHNINIDLLLIRTTIDFETDYFPLAAFTELIQNELFRLNIGAKNIIICQREMTREDTTLSLLSLYRKFGDTLHTKIDIITDSIKSGRVLCIKQTGEQQIPSMSDSVYYVGRNRYYVQLDLIPKKRVVLDIGLQWVHIKDKKFSLPYVFSYTTPGINVMKGLSRRISESLKLNLKKKIRIDIAPFTWDSADKDAAKLDTTIRYMLGTNLAKFPWIGVVDIPRDTLGEVELSGQQRFQRKAMKLKNYYMPEIAIRPGQLVFPNYAIIGHITSRQDTAIHVECWLVSIESQMVLAADKTSLRTYSLESLSKNMEAMTNRLSRSIEEIYILDMEKVRKIVVVPSRNMVMEEYYKDRVIEIIEGINRKLRIMIDSKKAALIENYGLIENLLNGTIDYDKMLTDLNPEYIMTIDVEETDQSFFLNLSFSSLLDPRDIPWMDKKRGDLYEFSYEVDTLLVRLRKINRLTDHHLFISEDDSILNKSGKKITKNDSLLKVDLDNSSISSYAKNYDITLGAGFLNRFKSSTPVFLSNNAGRLYGLTIDVSISNRLGIGGSIFYDSGGITYGWEKGLKEELGDIDVHQWILSLYPFYRFHYSPKFILFTGLGLSVFSIARSTGYDSEFQKRERALTLGGTFFAGFRARIYKHPNYNIFIDIRGGSYFGFEVDGDTVPYHGTEDFIFEGGNPGGLYIIGGVSASIRI